MSEFTFSKDDASINFGDLKIYLDIADRANRLRGRDDLIVMQKSRAYAEWHASFAAMQPRNILEFGVFKGGSTIFFDQLGAGLF